MNCWVPAKQQLIHKFTKIISKDFLKKNRYKKQSWGMASYEWDQCTGCPSLKPIYKRGHELVGFTCDRYKVDL